MSYFAAEQSPCTACSGPVALKVQPKLTDLGEFAVRRALPSARQRMVGPFVFFDHMGPAVFKAGESINVRPHPHIGIATITYLFEGEIMHRDSLGYEQPIRPGAVNLMVTGSGMVHSERGGSDIDEEAPLHGIQSWIGLPVELEETPPAFTHYPADQIPALEESGVAIRVIMGSFMGHTSPVQTFSRTLYLDLEMPAGSSLKMPEGERELAVYVATGAARIGEETVPEGTLAILNADARAIVEATEISRIMVIGGDPIGPRHMFWNFVSSRPQRIEQAKAQWRAGGFRRIAGDDEFIPLPGDQ